MNLKNPSYLLFFLLFCTFLILSAIVIWNDTIAFDTVVFEWLSFFDWPFVWTFMESITEFGAASVLTILTILLVIILLFTKKFKWALLLSLTMITGSILNRILKITIVRERPDILLQYDGFGYSYPSNHSMMSLLLYGFIILLFLRFFKPSHWRLIGILLLSILIIVIGLSRIYLGVHYSTDVVAGFILGLLLLIIVSEVDKKWNGRMVSCQNSNTKS
ncbi:hypothetical protein BTS2_1469 [Bacillus sp. TS-2]|nr:hypothetical protein BTS2_1469 [Bacillus sp. TS-2]